MAQTAPLILSALALVNQAVVAVPVEGELALVKRDRLPSFNDDGIASMSDTTFSIIDDSVSLSGASDPSSSPVGSMSDSTNDSLFLDSGFSDSNSDVPGGLSDTLPGDSDSIPGNSNTGIVPPGLSDGSSASGTASAPPMTYTPPPQGSGSATPSASSTSSSRSSSASHSSSSHSSSSSTAPTSTGAAAIAKADNLGLVLAGVGLAAAV